MSRQRYAFVGKCSKGHEDRIYGYDPDQLPALAEKFCDFKLRDEEGCLIGRCNAYQKWEKGARV